MRTGVIYGWTAFKCNYYCADHRLVSSGWKTFMVNQRNVAASPACPSSVTLVEVKELQKGKRVSNKRPTMVQEISFDTKISHEMIQCRND